jgi:formylglycine-generating enzyme required for sulfatase activity
MRKIIVFIFLILTLFSSFAISETAVKNVFTSHSLGAKFMLIPMGTFMMGSPSSESGRDSDETQHQVTISRPFYMQTTEVTQRQWRLVMGSNPSYFSNCGDGCPVEQVSWNDVQEFISRLNQREGTDKYRLPTEAEWEYAARAGSQADRYGDIDDIAWYVGNSGNKSHLVGQKRPNALGLYDMLGNVWEWCKDWKGDYSTGSVTDPIGPTLGLRRIYRGGGWGIEASSSMPPGTLALAGHIPHRIRGSWGWFNDARHCRLAYRYCDTPQSKDRDIGFRLVRTP